jgi:hypothetical protein
MENFITLYNYNYLPQGLSLYNSLKLNFKNFNLWVVCLDSKVENFLKKKNYSNLKIISLTELECKKLQKVKKRRSLVEYCWTLTPFLPSYFFKKYHKCKRITYIDADIFFFNSPKKIIDEFLRSKKKIYLTEHSFENKKDANFAGRFCVQYMIFKNEKITKIILKKWQNQCIKWCHAYHHNGKFGDQKYLDKWPTKYKKYICISKNNNFFQGPWNINKFENQNLIFYHFHGLKILDKKVYIFSKYGISKKALKSLYFPYVKILKKNLKIINDSFKQYEEKYLFINDLKLFFYNKFFKKKKINRFIFYLEKIK